MNENDYDAEFDKLKNLIKENISEKDMQKTQAILAILEEKEPEFQYSVNIDQGSTCQPEMKFIVA